MKASEVLKNYAAGETDFKGISLRGQSFERQNLSGADFSEADLRGTKFIGVDLRGTKFTGAKCGLQKRWATFLLIVSWLLALISGAGSLLVSSFVLLIFDASLLRNQIVGWVSLVVIVCFLILFIFKGIRIGGLFGMAIVALAFTGTISAILIKVISTIVSATISVGLAGTVSVAVISVGAIAGAIAGAVLGTGAILIAAIIPISLTIIGSSEVANAGAISAALSLAFASSVSITGIFIGWRAMKGDKKDAWINSFAIAVASKVGTGFYKSDLTQADFSKAYLKNVDFSETILSCTHWRDAFKIDRVCPGKTYLKNELLRQLLVTGNGKNQNFDRLDLRGVSLQKANLENASFIDADFYQTNLNEANLTGAILVRSNFERADLRNAKLSGSCIQDWVITESTMLDGIVCDYVFLKWINKDKRDQMPPRGKFKPGGFQTFVRYILETVELYHEKDINPRLALTLLHKMSRDYDEALDVVAVGKKGEKVFIQVKVSENIKKENFKDDYYARYDADLKLWSENSLELPPAMDGFIEKKISEIVSKKTDDFVFVDATYVEGNYAEVYQGEVNMIGDRNIEITDGDYVQGNKIDQSRHQNISGGTINNSGVGAFSLGDINGQVANTINELPNFYTEPDKKELKELLSELQTAVMEAELGEEDREDTLEQIQAIAKALADSQNSAMKKTAKTAMKMLRGTAAALPPSAAMVTICNQLPDLISKIF